MLNQIRVVILDNHQSIIDGYIYRFSLEPSIQVMATANFGDDLEPMLADHEADLLLMGLNVPNSATSHYPFPVFHILPRILRKHPDLKILVVSILNQIPMIEALIQTGISGYITKDDQVSTQLLAKIITIVANGGIYFSRDVYQVIQKQLPRITFTGLQLEALSLCAAKPEVDNVSLAKEMGIANSTLRNFKSEAYRLLGVRNRAEAVQKAHQEGLLQG